MLGDFGKDPKGAESSKGSQVQILSARPKNASELLVRRSEAVLHVNPQALFPHLLFPIYSWQSGG
jgi:hypothetical protein